MIVVFGSINMDTIIRVEKFPSVGETVVSKLHVNHPGGKGANQALTAFKMGSEVYFFGSVGRDNTGNTLLENFQCYGMDISGINVAAKLSGTTSITVADTGENMAIYTPGANMETKASFVPEYFLNESTILLTQMETSSPENWKLILRAKANKAKIVLNAAPVLNIPNEILHSIDILIVNEAESLKLAANLRCETTNFDEIAKYIACKYNIICVITLGGKGVLCHTPSDHISIPALDISPLDTTSAGDIFIGTMISYLDKGYSLHEGLLAGNIAGGLSTLAIGAQKSIPKADDVRSIFLQMQSTRSQLRIIF